MSPTLPMPLTYEILHDRAESLRRHADQVRPEPGHLTALRMFVRDCVHLPEDCRAMATEVSKRAWDELLALKPGSSFDATPMLERRRLSEQLLDALAAVIELCSGFVEAPTIKGKFVAEASSLRETLAQVREIREEFSENFPMRNEEEIRAARAEIAAGGGLELDDAFAEIAGCSKEEWLTRVQAREQQRKGA